MCKECVCMCVCVFLFSLACRCFHSPKSPTVLCLVWELSCHEYDPINTDHIYECFKVFSLNVSDTVLI